MAGITLDSSIYVSAFEFGGVCARLIGLARAGEFRVDVSDAIITEVIKVLREDFHWDGYSLRHAIERMESLGNKVKPARALQVIKEDPSDDRILECAVEAASDYIVTWDKDLLRLKEYEGIGIMTPVQFLERGRER